MSEKHKPTSSELKGLMAAVLAGDPDHQEIARLEQKLDNSPGLKKTWSRLKSLNLSIPEQKSALPESFHRELMQKIQALPRHSPPQARTLTRALGLPVTPAEMGLAMLNLGMFFLVAALVLMGGFVVLLAGPDLDFWFLICLVPGFAAALMLIILGAGFLKVQGHSSISLSCFIIPTVFFIASILVGLMFLESRVHLVPILLFGISGLISSGVLAVAGQQYLGRTVLEKHCSSGDEQVPGTRVHSI